MMANSQAARRKPKELVESTRETMQKTKQLAAFIINLIILPFLLVIIGFGHPPLIEQELVPSPADRWTQISNEKAYLPIISFADNFAEVPSIWLHASPPDQYEIVFFRYTFNVGEQVSTAELQIFADTRYELWLDGQFVGRGPARFSHGYHEYDSYSLEQINSGPHLLAVLVEWAPNTRRSESTTPVLQVRVRGRADSGKSVIFQTGSNWKANKVSAWEENAALVHTWELIGPTELLDLRVLPPDWMMPEFDDSNWANAAVINPAANSLYLPRSIPFLTDTPLAPTLYETGLLSPDRTLISTASSTLTTHSLSFTAADATDFSLEVLAVPTDPTLTTTILLDNQPLTWKKAEPDRPDVMEGNKFIQAGGHLLNISDAAQYPVYTVSNDKLTLTPVAFDQGIHAGKRLLLADPVPAPEAVIETDSAGLGLRFEHTPAYAILKFDRVVHGRMVAEVTGPAGTIVDVGWDIRLYNGFRPLPYPGSLHPQWNQTDSWILDGTKRSLTTIDARSGQYLLIAVWGAGPVEINSLVVKEEVYPVSQTGTFLSSDPLLDQIWQIGVETTKLNMLDAFAEPWRERGQWWGDAFQVDRVNRTVFGDFSLLRRGLLFMADGFENGKPEGLAPNGNGIMILDFGMLWVQDLKEYGLIIQEKPFLQDLYPTLLEFMEYLASYENAATGLLDIPQAHWSQSSYIDPRAIYSRHGQSTAVNALYANTLKNAAQVAYLLSDTTKGNYWQEKATLVSQQINTLLYLPEEGRYATTILNGTVYPPDPFAQAFPLAFELVPDLEIPAVATSLLELLSNDPAKPNVDVYGMAWVLEGLGRAGYIEESLEIIKLYYGHMIEKGATTWWESFTSYQSYWSSYSHGWGSSPTWFLSNFILGGSWTGPNTWTIRPALKGVEFASGSFPVKDGVVSISWTHQDCKQSYIEITVPSGTHGDVILPLDNQDHVFIDGSLLWKDGISLNGQGVVFGDELHVSIEQSGEHFLILQETCNYPYR